MSAASDYNDMFKDSVIKAFTPIIERLRKNLGLTDWVTTLFEDFDTNEALTGATGKDHEVAVQAGINDGLANLGRIQKRIDEVMRMRQEFEDSPAPSSILLAKVKQMLLDCALYEGLQMGMHAGATGQELAATEGTKDLNLEEVIWIRKALGIYFDALLAFGEVPPMWKKFPFDDRPDPPSDLLR